jgi:N4-gp56 family major capsid protein
MALGVNAYNDLNPETKGYISTTLLVRPQPLMPFEPFVGGVTLPANSTKTIVFRRFSVDRQVEVDNMYLTEGVQPAPQKMIQEEVSQTLRQIAGLIEITDILKDTHQNDIYKQAYQILAEDIPRLIERDRWYTLRACTNKYYTNGAARTDVNTPIDNSMMAKVVRNLERNSAMKITRAAKTGTEFNTESVAPAYIAVAHTDTRGDWEGLDGWTFVSDYPPNVKTYPGEIGALGNGNVRVLLSPWIPPYASAGGAAGAMISTDGVSADVYPIFIYGKDAWDSVAWKGQFATKPMIVPPESLDSGNRLGQVGSCGHKSLVGSLIKDDRFCVIVEAAATELT